MRGARLLAVLSLGTASLACSACDRSSAARETVAPTGLAALAHAVGTRPIEPRLTVGFPHAPCRSVERRGDLVTDAVCAGKLRAGSRRDLAKALRQIRAALKERYGPATLHADGVAKLLTGDSEESLDQAVTRLEEASSLDRKNAGLANDLAVALYHRAQRGDRPDDLASALDAARRAVEMDGSLLEARFNLALILEKLFLYQAAQEAWKEYRRLDTTSAWAEEARAHLSKLAGEPASEGWDKERKRFGKAAAQGDHRTTRAIAARFRQGIRELGEEELLGGWAEARRRGASDSAEESLAVARAAGSALDSLGGDRLLHDAVAVIDAAAAAGDAPRLRDLAEGHDAFRQGFRLYRKNQVARAAPLFATARRALTRAGSPFAARAALYGHSCEYGLGRYKEVMAGLRQLERQLGDRPYGGLLGHVAWLEGMIHAVQGDPVTSTERYEKALARFQGVREEANAGQIHCLLAQPHDQVGQRREAWRHRYLGLRGSRFQRTPRSRIMAFVGAADASLEHGRLTAALFFQNEVVRNARRHAETEQDVLLLTDALIWRSLIRSRAGLGREAFEDLRQARSLIRRLAAQTARRTEADAAMMEGLMLLSSNPAGAAGLLTSSLDLYEALEHRLLSLFVRQVRARAWLSVGDLDRAEADLRAAIEAYERFGTRSLPEKTHFAILGKVEATFDELISLQAVRRSRPKEAFETVDRARTRVLPARIAQTSLPEGARRSLLASEPRSRALDEISARLPKDTLLVQYAVLEDRVLVWWLRRGQRDPGFAVHRIGRGTLRKLCDRVRSFRGRDATADWEAASAWLFEILVRPWQSSARPEETVVIVSDKVLHAVPFSCLLDMRRRRYLVEDYRLVRTPSATLYVSTPALPGLQRGPRYPLVIGAPAFDRRLFESLPRLPGASRETAAVASLLPGRELLTGEAANKAAFRRLAQRANLVHFAGHAEVNPRDPLLSMLVLAPSEGNRGPLYAWEIYRLDLRGTDLVVLSACRTGEVAGGDGEGMVSLGRAFLAAGAPRVVASLWEVDDHRASRFFAEFYKSLRSGTDPVGALRAVQLRFLEGHEAADRSPSVWGAFDVIGVNG